MGEGTARQPRLLPPRTPLPAVADEAFDRLAAVVQTVLGVPVALVSLVDATQQVFPGAVGLPEPWQTERATPLTHSFCQYVVTSSEPLIVTDAREHPLVADNLAIPDLGVIAYAGMPLIDDHGAVAGSLCAIDTEPRVWTAWELGLLRDLAAAASAELQLRSAALRTAHESRRWRVLSALAEGLSSPLTVGEVARAVAGVAQQWLGATFGGLTLLDPLAETLTYVDLGELPEPVQALRTFPLDSARPSAIAVRTGAPLFFETLDELAEISPGTQTAAAATGGGAFAYLPLFADGRTLGSLGLIWSDPTTFPPDDRELLTGLSRYTAQAVHRCLLMADRRDAAHTLQTALLPTLPDVSWLDVAGRYHPAHTADAVGGDWFDAFPTVEAGNGSVSSELTVVVGDVTGHDTGAAAVMSNLQSGLRALAIDVPGGPDTLLERLDRTMARSTAERLATAVAATLSPQDDGQVRMSWSNAGHLAPLVVTPGGAVSYLETEPNRLLGLRLALGPRDAHTAMLPPGATVLLFTDGLVERRDASIDDGLATLADTVTELAHLPLAELLDEIIDRANADGHEDDTVVLAVRVPLQPPAGLVEAVVAARP